MGPEALRAFLKKRETLPAYEKGCAAFNVNLDDMLSQACHATRACKDSTQQPMDEDAQMATAVGFLQTICSDAVRPLAEARKLPAPSFPK